MTFQVPESKRSIAQNQFTFRTVANGPEYSIPKAKYLTTGQVERLSGKTGDLSIVDLLELFGDGDAAEAARTLDTEQLQLLIEAWQADSGVATGESSASTPK